MAYPKALKVKRRDDVLDMLENFTNDDIDGDTFTD